jgi:hypothetical protein
VSKPQNRTKQARKCPSGEACIAKPECKKSGPCWYYDVQKPTHDTIARLAREAGQKRSS